MNILVFSWRDPKHPLAGGAEQVMHEHMKFWVKKGNEVTLFSSRFRGSDAFEILDGINIVRSGNQYLGVQVTGFLYYLKNAGKFDLVVDQFHGLPFFTPLYVRKPKLAVIQEVAREVWFMNPLKWPLNCIVGIIGYIGEPFIFLPYRNVQFMTGSVSAKEDVKKFGIPEEQITIVPHGVIFHKPKIEPKKEKKFTVVFLGVLSKDKGIEDALKCFDLLKHYDNVQFWVIGKSETKEYYDKILKLVSLYGLEDKIKFWGYVSQEQKFKLLLNSHILINPSKREGWGLVNIEANSVGVPVVAYTSPGLVDSVKNGISGILCSQNTSKILTDNILKLYNDPTFYKSLQIGSRKWSKNFTWNTSIKKSIEIINKI